MRHGRRPGRRKLVATSLVDVPAGTDAAVAKASSARCCDTCGEEIGARRLRAMPRTTLCLDCQRSAERPETTT
jgi:hypothetical protein